MLSSLVRYCCGALASAFMLGTAVARGDELICHPLSPDLAQVRYDVRPVSKDNFVTVTVPRRVGEFHFRDMKFRAGPRNPGQKALKLLIPSMPMFPAEGHFDDPDEMHSMDPDNWRNSNFPNLETWFMAADFHNSSIELSAIYHSEPPTCVSFMEIQIFPQPPSPSSSPGPPH